MLHGNVVQTKILMVLLRGYSPKGEDISGIFDSQIQEWANKLNTRPREMSKLENPLMKYFLMNRCT